MGNADCSPKFEFSESICPFQNAKQPAYSLSARRSNRVDVAFQKAGEIVKVQKSLNRFFNYRTEIRTEFCNHSCGLLLF